MTDGTDETPRFDPRFDPAFQPGYRPDAHAGSSAPRPLRREPASPAAQPLASESASALSSSPAPSAPPSRRLTSASPLSSAAPSSALSLPIEHGSEPPVRVRELSGQAPMPHGPKAELAEDAAPDAVPAAAPRVNPVIVAIWALSLLFVIGGVYGLRFVDERFSELGTSGGFGNSDYYLLQAYSTGAPMLIVLGLASFTGTLFLYAARWRRRP